MTAADGRGRISAHALPSPPGRPSRRAGALRADRGGDERGGRTTLKTDRTAALRMAQPQLQDLLEAGVHFGHQTRRWNPKMRRFIFAERNGIHIIDLQKTLRQIEMAQELAARRRAQGRERPLRLHEEAAQGHRAGRGRALRRVLRHRALARRPADQLPDGQEADPPAEGARAGRGRAASSRTTRRRNSCSSSASA